MVKKKDYNFLLSFENSNIFRKKVSIKEYLSGLSLNIALQSFITSKNLFL